MRARWWGWKILKFMTGRWIFQINVTEKFIRHTSPSPLLALSHFCEKREKNASCETRRVCVRAEESTLSYSLPLFSLLHFSFSFSCVFYCKLRLKSLAQSQAFHLGRCIPADAYSIICSFIYLAYARISITYTRGEVLLHAACRPWSTIPHVHIWYMPE